MHITIYKHPHQTAFIGVPHGATVPDDYQDWRYFKSIHLLPGQPRIGMLEPADTILGRIEEVGWSVM